MFQIFGRNTSCLRFRSPSESRPSKPCGRTFPSSSPSRAVWLKSSTTPSRSTTGMSTPLADAIYGLIEYPALAKMFASKGLAEVTNLKWNDAAAKIKKVYEDAIEESKNQSK